MLLNVNKDPRVFSSSSLLYHRPFFLNKSCEEFRKRMSQSDMERTLCDDSFRRVIFYYAFSIYEIENSL